MAFTKSVATANSAAPKPALLVVAATVDEFYGGLNQIGDSTNKKRVAVMKMQFLLAGIVAAGLFASVPGAVAHGGSGGGGGHGGGSWGGHGGGSWGGHGGGSWGGHGGGSWGGHGGGSWGGHGRGFHHGGRFFGPGFGFYGYPWWWDGYYPGYAYYPYPYYGDPYYSNPYYGNPYYGNPSYGNPSYGNPYYGNPYYGSSYYGSAYYGNPYYENRDPRSSATKAVQAALARRGYYRGAIDGALGPETRNAIRSFQAHQGLPVTGQMDGRLIRALQS